MPPTTLWRANLSLYVCACLEEAGAGPSHKMYAWAQKEHNSVYSLMEYTLFELMTVLAKMKD